MKRVLIFLVFLAVSMTSITVFAQESITPDVDFIRVGYANVKTNSKDSADFFDNPEAYLGKTIQIAVFLRAEGGLRAAVGKLVPFRADYYAPTRIPLYISIPEGLNVPNASPGDELIVIFRCTKGSLDSGNIAMFVTRY